MSTINFSGTPTTLNLGESTELVAEVNGIGSSLFSWLSNGNPIGEGNPLTYTPTEVGVEDITLEVKVPSNVSDGSVGSCPIGESYYIAGEGSIFDGSDIDTLEGMVNNGSSIDKTAASAYVDFGATIKPSVISELIVMFNSYFAYNQSNVENSLYIPCTDYSVHTSMGVLRIDKGDTTVASISGIRSGVDITVSIKDGVLKAVDSYNGIEIQTSYEPASTTHSLRYINGNSLIDAHLTYVYIVGSGLPNECQGMWETIGTLTKPDYLNITEETITNLFERVRNMEFKIPNTKEVSLNGENVSCTANTFQQLKPKYAKEYCGDNINILLTEQATIKDINGDEVDLATLPSVEAQEYLNKVFAFLARFNV